MELPQYLKNLIPILTQTRHKGQNGKIGVIGGSFEYTGAPYYAAITILKGGGDLSHVFCTKQSGTPIKSYSPELIVHPLLISSQESDYQEKDVEQAVHRIQQWLPTFHGFVFGPGLGRDPLIQSYLHKILASIEKIVVIDADGLWYLLQNEKYLSIVNKNSKNIILTPNGVEMQRLQKALNIEPKFIEESLYLQYLDKTVQVDLDEDIVFNAVELSKSLNNITIIVKGLVDLVTDGRKAFVIGEQGSLKRCGGLGDILSGLTCLYSYWAQESQQEIIYGCVFASLISRKAAALAYKKFMYSLSCPNVIDHIGQAFSEFNEQKL